MPRRLVLLALALAVGLAGCGSSKKAGTTTAVPTPTGPTHAATDLEALLPGDLDGEPLTKGSTTGAVVFGGDSFSKALSKFLDGRGKSPSDLRFANARSEALGLEAGVFEVAGIDGQALSAAIVAASKPNAPGLTSTPATLADRQVVRLTYPGGTLLYLYPHEGRVFYVGTQSESRARDVLARLP